MVAVAQTKQQEIVQERLPNGLRVVVAPMPWTRSVTVSIYVGAGSRYETPKINGVSHFLEHLFFGGTKRRPSSKEISEAIEGVGGYFNAYTSEDKTGFYAKVPAQHAERAFDVLSDMLTGSVFDPSKIDRERGVVTEEINLYNDDPGKQIQELFPAVMWPDQPLGMTVLGPKEVIARLSREEILAYIERQYRAENMVISVAGAIEPSEACRLGQQYFGGLPSGPGGAAEPAREVPGARVQALDRAIDQNHFMMGVYAPSLTREERFAARIISSVLGEGMSSRLFLKVREQKGLAYSVRSFYDGLIDTGAINVKAGVNVDKADLAIRAVLEEFEELCSSPIPQEEFDKARESIKGNLVVSIEETSAVSDWLGGQLVLLGRLITLEELLEAYDRVDRDATYALAQELFRRENLKVTAIGPGQSEERLRAILERR